MSKEGEKKEMTAYFEKHDKQGLWAGQNLLLIKAICLELSPLSFLDSSLLVDTVYVYFCEFLGILLALSELVLADTHDK